MLKLVNEKHEGAHVLKMEDGDVAVIVSWPYNGCVGRVVQRYENTLISLGLDSDHSWRTLFSPIVSGKCRVRILEKGETLVVEN